MITSKLRCTTGCHNNQDFGSDSTSLSLAARSAGSLAFMEASGESAEKTALLAEMEPLPEFVLRDWRHIPHWLWPVLIMLIFWRRHLIRNLCEVPLPELFKLDVD